MRVYTSSLGLDFGSVNTLWPGLGLDFGSVNTLWPGLCLDLGSVNTLWPGLGLDFGSVNTLWPGLGLIYGQEIWAHINRWPMPGLGQPYVSVNTFGLAVDLVAIVTWAAVVKHTYIHTLRVVPHRAFQQQFTIIQFFETDMNMILSPITLL